MPLTRMGPTIDCAREIQALRKLQAELAGMRAELGAHAAAVVPEASSWSAEQHLYHVALSADLALANVRALLDGTSARIVHEGAPNELALRVFAEGGYPRGQSQAPRAVWPPDRPDPVFLAGEIERLREGVVELEGRAEAIEGAGGRISHRQLGELRAAEWLRFARLHTEHHLAIVREIALVWSTALRRSSSAEPVPPEGGTTNQTA